jgi:hypothetical protein
VANKAEPNNVEPTIADAIAVNTAMFNL